MYLREYTPHPGLRAFIRSYLHIRVASGAFHFPADGCPGLVINLGDPFLLGFEKERLAPISDCLFFGAQTRNVLTQHGRGLSDVLCVKIEPGQLSLFTDAPAKELTDRSVSIQELWGARGRRLTQRLMETRPMDRLVSLLDGVLLERLRAREAPDTRTAAALDAICHCHGQIRVGALAKSMDWSSRHLTRQFSNQIGLSPKRACRIARFLGVISSVRSVPETGWADLAFAAGYSDQAHLIRECIYFTGRSPIAFVRDRSPIEHAVTGTDCGMSDFFNPYRDSSDRVGSKSESSNTTRRNPDERALHSRQPPC